MYIYIVKPKFSSFMIRWTNCSLHIICMLGVVYMIEVSVEWPDLSRVQMEQSLSSGCLDQSTYVMCHNRLISYHGTVT